VTGAAGSGESHVSSLGGGAHASDGTATSISPRGRPTSRRRPTPAGPARPPPPHTKASAVSAGAGPYLSGAIVKLARPWLTLRTAAE